MWPRKGGSPASRPEPQPPVYLLAPSAPTGCAGLGVPAPWSSLSSSRASDRGTSSGGSEGGRVGWEAPAPTRSLGLPRASFPAPHCQGSCWCWEENECYSGRTFLNFTLAVHGQQGGPLSFPSTTVQIFTVSGRAQRLSKRYEREAPLPSADLGVISYRSGPVIPRSEFPPLPSLLLWPGAPSPDPGILPDKGSLRLTPRAHGLPL